jgi:hypothetical protein
LATSNVTNSLLGPRGKTISQKMSKNEKKDNPFEVRNESFIHEYHYTYCNNALENMGIICMQRHKM